MKKFLILAIIPLILSSCSRQRSQFVDDSTLTNARYVQDSSGYFFGGLGQSDEVDAEAVCGNSENVAAVESRLSPGNIAVSIFTLGIYTPRSYRVYCVQ